jgi:hypothetical protein
MHRLLLETLWQSSGRVTEVLRLRLSPMPQRCTKCRVPNSRWWSLYVDQSCHHARSYAGLHCAHACSTTGGLRGSEAGARSCGPRLATHAAGRRRWPSCSSMTSISAGPMWRGIPLRLTTIRRGGRGSSMAVNWSHLTCSASLSLDVTGSAQPTARPGGAWCQPVAQFRNGVGTHGDRSMALAIAWYRRHWGASDHRFRMTVRT